MPHIYYHIPMYYLQFLSFASRGNSLNSHIKVNRFCHFLKFLLKKVFRKIKISQRRKKVATDLDRFSESSEHYLSPITSSFFPYFKASCRKSHLKVSRFFCKVALNLSHSCDVITTSLWSHVSHFIHLITFFEAMPIDCYLDQLSIFYGCWDTVAQNRYTLCDFVLYILSRTPFYQFHKEHPKNTKFWLSITQKPFIEFLWNFYSLLIYYEWSYNFIQFGRLELY